MISLAILGCGAIARRRHIPAAVEHPGINLVALVDADLKRAKALREAYSLDCRVVVDYREVMENISAVINALPNHLHAPVNLDVLRAGIHVLCEKPLAITAAEARACCQVAEQKDVVLAAAMAWRFRESSVLLRLVLEEGLLDPVQGYDWEYGMPFDWPTASGFYFSRAQAGGGILLDEGVHILDCLRDWFGPVMRYEYRDDNWGSGLEANAELTLSHKGRHGNVHGRIRLSRTYALKNRLQVQGTQCRAEIRRTDHHTLYLYRCMGGQEVCMALRAPEGNGTVPRRDPFYQELEDFVESIRSPRKPAVDGWQALETIELVENCYAKAGRLPEPWLETCATPTKLRV